MGLIEKIDSDLKEALRSHDEHKLAVLRLVKTGLTNVEKKDGTPATDDDAASIIKREIKQRQDTIAQLQASRPTLIEQDTQAIALLQTYLPQQLSREELEAIVTQVTNQTGATTLKDMGKVMAIVMAQTKGQADGQTVSELVKKKLS